MGYMLEKQTPHSFCVPEKFLSSPSTVNSFPLLFHAVPLHDVKAG